MSAEDQEGLGVRLDVAAEAFARERARSIALSRELRVLEDSLAEARSVALENEQAARAARFRTAAEMEARLAAQAWGAELAEQLTAIRASKAFRFVRALGVLARLGGRRSA